MISADALKFLGQSDRRYVLATRRGELNAFSTELCRGGWKRLEDHLGVEVKLLERAGEHYLLARSRPRRQKERAIRRRQRRGLAKALKKLHQRVGDGRLKDRDKILESVGRLKRRFPKAAPFVTVTVAKAQPARLSWTWLREKFRAALMGDGAYLLRSNQGEWSATEFWETYIQLTVVERAFRVLKSELLLRPVWHRYSGRTQAHEMICVLAYALWKTLDHLAKRAGLQTLIRKGAPEHGAAAPQPRPMTPESILRKLAQIAIGDIVLETTEGQATTALCELRVSSPRESC
jgi:hypothetical protein